MRITIIGPGAIGLLLAASLKKENKLSVLVKKEKRDILKKKGLWITKGNQKKRINADIVTKLSDTDIVIIAVKAYDLKSTNAVLKDFRGKIIICQNGLEVINYLPPNANDVSLIVTSVGAISSDTGVSDYRGSGTTVIGSLTRNNKPMINFEGLFSEYYFTMNHVENIATLIWLKAVINSAINPIASLYNLKNGELKKDKYLILVKDLLNESVSIAIANGVEFHDDPLEETMKIIDRTHDNICSMLQDLRKGRKTEINEINGLIAQIGKEKNMNTKLNSEYLEKIKSIS